MIKCEICGDINNLHTKTKNNKYEMILCNKHYTQLRNHNKILDRTIYDKNEIIIETDCAKICLYDLKGNIIDYAIIDIEDVSIVKDYKWGIHNGKYVRSVSNSIYLHKLIVNYIDNELDVDHINRNTLDNRKCNLRITTHQENSINRSLPKNNKTNIIGVFWDKTRNKWRAEIRCDNINYYLGRFENFNDAVVARLKAEFKYFGEFAPQRHLYEKYNI